MPEEAKGILKQEGFNEEDLKFALQGNYYDGDIRIQSLVMPLSAGLVGLDLPMDARDIYYDFTHFEPTLDWAGNTALDSLALLPVIGGLKYADEIALIAKNSDEAAEAAKGAGKVDGVAGANSTDNVGVKFSPSNPCDQISREVAESFSGATFTKRVLTEDTTMYRVSGGNAKEVGSYMSMTPQGGGLQSQLDLALNPQWGNTTEKVTKVIVPKGTTIYEGIAAPQNIYDSFGNVIGQLSGGGSQIYIPKVDTRWFQ